jgi:hypothetical protein
VGSKSSPDQFDQQNRYYNQKIALENLKGEIAYNKAVLKAELGLKNNNKMNLSEISIAPDWKIDKEKVLERALKYSNNIKLQKKQIKLVEAQLNKAKLINQPEIQVTRLTNNLKLAKIKLKQEKHRLGQSIKKQFYTYDQGLKQIRLLKMKIKQLQKNYDILKEEYESGRITGSNLITAEISLLEGKQSLLKSICDYYLIGIRLKQTIGIKVGVNIDDLTK